MTDLSNNAAFKQKFMSTPVWVELLYETSRQFASSLELDEVLGKVLSLTVKALGADVGSIFLVDKGGRVIRSILARQNLPPQVKYPTVAAVMSKGFAGWVYLQQKADILEDTDTDDRWHTFADDTLATRSAMAAPLIRRDHVIGVITLTHEKTGFFKRDQLDLVEAIAGQAASAVENAALYTRVNNERSMLRAIIAGVQDTLLVTDTRDNIILANPACAHNLNVQQSHYGQSVFDVVNEDSLISFYQSIGDQNDEREIVLSNGRMFDCAIVSVPNVGKIVGLHDISTLKKLDAMKSEFVSQVSHDLKAPLGIIYGYAWLMTDFPNLTEEEQGYVQEIIEAIDRMRALIDNLLDIGRIEMGIEAEFEYVDITQVVSDAIKNMQGLAREKSIHLTAEHAPDLPRIKAAPVRLGQAVANLIGNALKFTPTEGYVTVKTAVAKRQLHIKIVDTGPGIPPKLQTQLFKKFSKLGQEATRGNEGHGLGLAIVKSVVDAHHGKVWVESEFGNGSTFVISLPL